MIEELRPSDLRRINLRHVNCLLIDNMPFRSQIMENILLSYGVQDVIKAGCIDSAKDTTSQCEIDFVFIQYSGLIEESCDFVSWLRRHGGSTNRFAPVAVVLEHARKSDVFLARDSGAHLTMSKPITPKGVFDRLYWLASSQRPFIECPTFCGPDRRISRSNPPTRGPGGIDRRDGRPPSAKIYVDI